jgi:hypothetical protein
MRSFSGLLASPKAFSCIFKFLAVKDLVRIGSLDKQMNTLLIDNTAGRICLNFIKVKYVNEQPQFKVTYYDNQAMNKLMGAGGGTTVNPASRNA